MKKSMSYLIESELEKAEVILAAKAISDQIGKLAETVAKIEADDLMPLGDTLHTLFGGDLAANFSTTVSDKLRELTQNMVDARNAISDAINGLDSGEMPSNDGMDNLETMPDDALSGDDKASDDGTDEDQPFDMGGGDTEETPLAEPTTDADDFSSTLDTNRAGRAKKPSFESVDPDRALVKEYSKLLREGLNAGEAAKKIHDDYGVSPSLLVNIMEGLSK